VQGAKNAESGQLAQPPFELISLDCASPMFWNDESDSAKRMISNRDSHLENSGTESLAVARCCPYFASTGQPPPPRHAAVIARR
jgi:hypothetical protein